MSVFDKLTKGVGGASINNPAQVPFNNTHESFKSEDQGSQMNSSLKNALTKMMQNKEQDLQAKVQFREDLDHMGDNLKFAISALD